MNILWTAWAWFQQEFIVNNDLLKQVISAAAGGIIGFFGTTVWQFIRYLAVSSKQNASGEYLAEYTENKPSGHHLAKSVVELRQYGPIIRGKERNSIDDKEYKLRGEMTKDGRIVGRYASIKRLNRGEGNFMLTIRDGNLLEGVWAGYANELGRVDSGTYLLRRRLDVNVTFESLDHPAAETRRTASLICGRDLNLKVVTRGRLYKARFEGKTIAALLVEERGGTVGNISFFAVAEKYRNRFVGTQLLAAAIGDYRSAAFARLELPVAPTGSVPESRLYSVLGFDVDGRYEFRS